MAANGLTKYGYKSKARDQSLRTSSSSNTRPGWMQVKYGHAQAKHWWMLSPPLGCRCNASVEVGLSSASLLCKRCRNYAIVHSPGQPTYSIFTHISKQRRPIENSFIPNPLQDSCKQMCWPEFFRPSILRVVDDFICGLSKLATSANRCWLCTAASCRFRQDIFLRRSICGKSPGGPPLFFFFF